MQIKKVVTACFLFVSIVTSFSSQASENTDTQVKYPYYIGVTGGYGSTTWGGLVPKDPTSLSLSTPVRVSEGGALWGVYGGYEFMPNFAIEGSYTRYPTAHLYFDEENDSLFTIDHGLTRLSTRTESVALDAKLMVVIPHTKVRAYSSFGVAEVHRFDSVVDRWRLSPHFGAGFNFNLSDHFVVEFGTDYTAGYAQPEMDPADHFIPFLYSFFMRLAVHV